jgi:hypothetical protein
MHESVTLVLVVSCSRGKHATQSRAGASATSHAIRAGRPRSSEPGPAVPSHQHAGHPPSRWRLPATTVTGTGAAYTAAGVSHGARGGGVGPVGGRNDRPHPSGGLTLLPLRAGAEQQSERSDLVLTQGAGRPQPPRSTARAHDYPTFKGGERYRRGTSWYPPDCPGFAGKEPGLKHISDFGLSALRVCR